jgi:nitrite reductase/ring-hydroxylating ferredoxin subunit
MRQPELQYLRLCFAEHTPGSLKRFLDDEEEVLVVRLEHQCYALEESCTHRG